MLLADLREPLLSIILVIAIMVVIIGVGVMLFFGFQRLPARSLRRKYEGLAIHSIPEPGDVIIAFHTYHGFLVWFTQTEHQTYLAPSDARILIDRLMRFNLVWGLLAAGSIFVLPWTIIHYFSQRRSITAQEASNERTAAKLDAIEDAAESFHHATTMDAIKVRPASTSPQSMDRRDEIQTAPANVADGAPRDRVIPPESRSHAASYSDRLGQDAFADIAIPTPGRRSFFLRIFGWISAGLCATFAVSSVVFLVQAQFEAAIGGVVLAVLLGAIARDWFFSC